MKSKHYETWGNASTMNLNNIIYTNIMNSPYYRELGHIDNFLEVIDEIYNHVSYLDPFATGSAPSSAFCLLFKLWDLKLTLSQIYILLDHVDSPYIRAIGFLYLRYVCKPDYLWEWFEHYLDDEEEFALTKGPRPTMMTIGKLCVLLLEEQKFLGTILPRIPVKIAREIEKSLSKHSGGVATKSSRRSTSPSKRSSTSRRERSRSPIRESHDSRRYRDDYRDDYRDRDEPSRSRRRSRSRSPARSRYGSEAYRYSRY